MRKINTLLVDIKLVPGQRERLIKRLPDAEIIFAEQAPTDEQLARADVIFGNVRRSAYPAAKNLRWEQLTSAGSDMYADAVPEDVILTNATGSYGPAISEHMIGMVLALQKRFLQRKTVKKSDQTSDRTARSQ